MSARTVGRYVAFVIAVPIIIMVGFIGGVIVADLARGLQ